LSGVVNEGCRTGWGTFVREGGKCPFTAWILSSVPCETDRDRLNESDIASTHVKSAQSNGIDTSMRRTHFYSVRRLVVLTHGEDILQRAEWTNGLHQTAVRGYIDKPGNGSPIAASVVLVVSAKAFLFHNR